MEAEGHLGPEENATVQVGEKSHGTRMGEMMRFAVRRDHASRVTEGQQVGSAPVGMALSCRGRISSLVASRASGKGAGVVDGAGIRLGESWFCHRLTGQPRRHA